MNVIFGLLAQVAATVGMRLLNTLVAPKMLEWTLFTSAEWLAKHTKTSFDDEGVKKVKEAYYGGAKEGPQ